MPPYVEVPDSVLGVDKPVRSFDHKQQRDNIKFHHHGQSGVDGVFAGVITPTQLTANQNDYNPTGLATASTVRVSSDKVVAITGMQQGLEGQAKVIMNVGSFTINFPAEHTGSSAANRFANGFTLQPGRMVIFVYDSVAQRWRTDSFGTVVSGGDIPLNIIKLGGVNFGQASTAFLKWIGGGGDSEANVEVYVIRPFTMQELRGFAAAAVPASNSVSFTVRKNGADTALTCTIGAGQTQAADTTNKVNFGRGDRFAIKVISSATAGTNDYSATAKVMKPDQEVGLPCIFYKGSIITAGNSFAEFGAVSEFGTSAALSLPLPRCLSSYAVPAKYGTEGFVMRKNNVDALTGIDTVTIDHVQYDDACRISMDEGDKVSVVAAANGSSGSCQIFFESADPTKHDPCPMGWSFASVPQGSTRYGASLQATSGIIAEGEGSIPMPACRVKNLRGIIDTTPALGETVTVTVRKNGAGTALALTFTNAGGTTASNLTDEITFAPGDYMSVEGVTSAGVGTRTFSVSMEPFA